jgi:catechol 2,3-dioxygenase-like lactoylglutathione lyase family enzyme
MIDGAHVVIYSRNSEADRAFFRDVLNFPSVDAGHGWLIFALPPCEAAFHDQENDSGNHDSGDHDSGNSDKHELYLMCDDIAATLKDLKAKKVEVSDVTEQRWGSLARFSLPGGGKVGIYQPKHASPLNPKRK